MTIEEMLAWLTANCNEWSMEVNPHKGYYETIEEHIKKFDEDLWNPEFLNAVTIVKLRVYPITPVACWVLFADSIEEALTCAVKHRQEEIAKGRV